MIFSLEKFIRESGKTSFLMQVVHTDEVSVEMEVSYTGSDEVFRCYIENSAILPKSPTDKLRELFGGLNKTKFTSRKNWRTQKG